MTNTGQLVWDGENVKEAISQYLIPVTTLTVTGPWEGKRFVDLSENAMYWYFVVIAWVPIYGMIYLAPRLL